MKGREQTNQHREDGRIAGQPHAIWGGGALLQLPSAAARATANARGKKKQKKEVNLSLASTNSNGSIRGFSDCIQDGEESGREPVRTI